MGNFSGIGEYELYEKGVYLTPGGSYELEVQNILLKNTRKVGLGFIVEFKIVSVTGEDAEAKHPPGSKATWFQKMADKDIALPAIKDFMRALLNVDFRDPAAKEEFNDSVESLLDEVTNPVPAGEEHALAGHKVHCDTYTKLTQKKLEFTAHNWSPSEESA